MVLCEWEGGVLLRRAMSFHEIYCCCSASPLRAAQWTVLRALRRHSCAGKFANGSAQANPSLVNLVHTQIGEMDLVRSKIYQLEATHRQKMAQ